MKGSVLVTGAAGFAGSHLLELLLQERGVKITAWRRPKPKARLKADFTPAGAADDTIVWDDVDILDREAVFAAAARAQPSIVFHCAGAAHVGQAWNDVESTLAINVRGTHHLLDALERTSSGRVRVVIPGSALVYKPSDQALTEASPLVPSGPYGLSKLAQEKLGLAARDARIETVVARAFNHFGPRQDPAFAASGFARQIAAIERGLQEPVIRVGNLEARRDLTDVRDTVRAYAALAEQGLSGEVYNVCSGRAVPIGDLLHMLLSRARTRVRTEIDPTRLRPSDVPVLLGDPSRIRNATGWTADTPLERTIEDVLTYWREVAL